MVTAIIQHEVRDFKEWKNVFDQDVPNPGKVGAPGTAIQSRNCKNITSNIELKQGC
jgi:hypothetical protein